MGGFGHFLRGAGQTFQDLIADRYQQQQLAQTKQLTQEQVQAENERERNRLAEEIRYHKSLTAAEMSKTKAAIALQNAQAQEISHNIVTKSLQYGVPIPGAVETGRQATTPTGETQQMSPAGWNPNYQSTLQLPIQTASMDQSV